MIARSADDGTLEAAMSELTSRDSSRIDDRTTIDGTIATSADLRVEGRVQGSISCDGGLYVADGAEIDGTVEAGGIVVAGTLQGTVRCRGLMEIRATGVVRAQVETERLIIIEGAL